ncbi:MAG TPA: hypothetical protein DCY13_15105 [Verrucomicrobiales bacterium]|nr:hypothetical protein [Verrucomicrobiales bacterium]
MFHTSGSRRFAAILFGAVATLSFDAFAGEGVEITRSDNTLLITVNDQIFSRYHYQRVSRPFLWPVFGPGETPMTRDWPMHEGVNDEKDHPHHRSLWFAHGEINGVDFWSESANAGSTVHEEFVEVKSGREHGVIKSRNKLVAKDGKLIATDLRTIRIYNTSPHRMMDYDVTIFASEGDLVFGDTKEGTMAIRVAPTMRLKGKVAEGHIVNSEGVTDGATWGKRAKWCDYYGPVNGKIVGVAIFDAPRNPRHPTWWHVRDYGLFAANPFGQHDFEKKEKGIGDLQVKQGESVTFRYRFFFHEGTAAEADIEARYQEYAAGK